MSVLRWVKSVLGLGSGERASAGDDGIETRDAGADEAAGETDQGVGGTPLDGDVARRSDLSLTSTAFEEGEQMPDWVGYANENENPRLEISGVPDDAESLVLVMDDPDAEPVVGHVYDHWLVWDVDPDREEIPRGWQPGGGEATVGYNDYVEQDWGGPAPPEGSHTYYFKLFALDSELGAPAPTRKARLGSMMVTEAEILAATQLTGTYDAEQGTIF